MPNQRKLLIIDDEEDLCLLLKDYFIKKGYEVYISHTLNGGRELLDATRADVVFLDNNLPDGIGWDMAPGIAKSLPETYLVLVSAFHPSAPVMPEGANYRVIEKPISLAELNRQFAGF